MIQVTPDSNTQRRDVLLKSKRKFKYLTKGLLILAFTDTRSIRPLSNRGRTIAIREDEAKGNEREQR